MSKKRGLGLIRYCVGGRESNDCNKFLLKWPNSLPFTQSILSFALTALESYRQNNQIWGCIISIITLYFRMFSPKTKTTY